MSISHRWRGWIASAMILVMVFGLQLHYNGDWSLNADAGLQVVTSRTVTGIIKLAGSPLLLEFIVGMLLAGIYHSVPSGIHLPKDHWLRRASVAVCWIGGALYAALYFGPIGNFHGPSGFGMWALVAFVPALFYEKLNAVTPNKALMFLGEISYSLYMSHIIVMTFFEMHYQRYFPAFPQVIGISRFVLLTLVSIVVAYLVHVAVEKPAMNIARRLLAAGRRKDTQRGKEIAA
ncbi:acyltransferase [Pandoraea apista]|nr:acyltransferase [Pandoraea apista]